MADLANPTVHVAYGCGCSFTDTREHNGIKVAESDEQGKPTGRTITLTGIRQFRYGGDETEAFRTRQQLEQARNATERRRILTDALARVPADTAKPSRASLEALTPDQVYQALLTNDAASVPDTVSDGIRFPQPPGRCPRHGESALHTHTSYLGPADPPKADRTETGLAESTVEGAKP